MTQEHENTHIEQEEDTIILDAKVQTIYYVSTTGEMDKHHHVSNTRLNTKKAKEILEQEGIEIEMLLRTATERIGVQLTREELQQRITTSDRFYQGGNN